MCTVTKTFFTLRVLGYKNKQREIRLQKHTESVGYKNNWVTKKNNPVTKTGLQKKFHAPPYPVAQ